MKPRPTNVFRIATVLQLVIYIVLAAIDAVQQAYDESKTANADINLN